MERCCVCGRFCRPVDSSTPFGSGGDIDPPDEEFYCAKCVEKEKSFFIEHNRLPANWRKAKWEFDVAKVLGYVLIHLDGAGWNIWHKQSEPMPKGYILDEVK